ncbi:MAG TPA: sigma 54-interacting transcriptional regulator [Polyangiaceae bacterium]
MRADPGSTVPEIDAESLKNGADLGLLWIFPDAEPRFVQVEEQAIIGREPGSDILVEAEQVSRRHALVRRNGPLLVVEDLGSRNGTYVDGRRIEKAPLEAGSLLRVGESLALISALFDRDDPRFGELAPGFFGGPTLARRMRDLARVAASDLSVVVQGRTGCGKEVVARALHRLSAQRGQFVPINCAALPASLAESQLFGHKRGAFTGAERNEVGFIGSANGGTLFFDEVLDLALPIQAKLLRVLQEHEYVPVGETRGVPVSLRVVAASQRPLEQAVAAGEFREDLFARLNGYRFILPTLAERREDIPYLLRHFLANRFGGRPPLVRARLVETLCLHAWPRNVRELETVAKRLSVLHGHEEELRHEHLSDVLDSAEDANARDTSDAAQDDQTGRDLVAALSENGGNVVRAAQKLGISRARAYRIMLALGIDAERYRSDALSRKRRGD